LSDDLKKCCISDEMEDMEEVWNVDSKHESENS
jgi:hypothetical protein